MKVDQTILDAIWKEKGFRFIEVSNGYILEDPNAHYPMVKTAVEVFEIYLSTSPLMKALN